MVIFGFWDWGLRNYGLFEITNNMYFAVPNGTKGLPNALPGIFGSVRSSRNADVCMFIHLFVCFMFVQSR